MLMKKMILPLVLMLSAQAQAQAQQLWIEQDLNGARLYLGEFSENQRESSPGGLDKLTQTSAQLLMSRGEQEAGLSRQGNFLALGARAIPGESLVAQELAYPGWEQRQGDKLERHVLLPAARWISDFAARAPRLTLDLVPTGRPGQLQAFYKGQPLPEAKLQLLSSFGWGRSLRADKQGLVQLSLPWRGVYVVELQQVDREGGQRQGQAWDVARYITTLSLQNSQGLLPPGATGAGRSGS